MRPRSPLPLEERRKINQANYRSRVREQNGRLLEVRLSSSAIEHLQHNADCRGLKLRAWFAQWVDAKVREEATGHRS